MSLLEHAKKELELAKLLDKDSPYGGMIGEAVLELVEVFSKQEHSGNSANWTSNIFDQVARYKPLSPLTGEDSEWNEVTDTVWQNNRMSTIFKQSDRFDGKPYNIDGKVFTRDNGKSWFTNSDSFVVIEFPYTYKEPEKVYLNKEEEAND